MGTGVNVSGPNFPGGFLNGYASGLGHVFSTGIQNTPWALGQQLGNQGLVGTIQSPIIYGKQPNELVDELKHLEKVIELEDKIDRLMRSNTSLAKQNIILKRRDRRITESWIPPRLRRFSLLYQMRKTYTPKQSSNTLLAICAGVISKLMR
jgi:hypothetical protein